MSPVDAKEDVPTSSAMPACRGLFADTDDLPSSDSDSDWEEEEDVDEEPDLTESLINENVDCVVMNDVSQC